MALWFRVLPVPFSPWVDPWVTDPNRGAADGPPPIRGTSMKLTFTKACEYAGRSYEAGQVVLMTGYGAIDLLNAGMATCDDGRCGHCPDETECQTASVNPTSERATKKRAKKSMPAEGEA